MSGKVEKEQVLHEHEGDAHLTLDEQGRVHHYERGCPFAKAETRARSGPAMFATDAFREGYAGIKWGEKPKPS